MRQENMTARCVEDEGPPTALRSTPAEGSSPAALWEVLQTVLPNEREQRLTYLLYHCGLSPREIVRFCPQEWSDVQEIYRLRRTIMERLLRHADHLRWWLR